MLQD
ncbi:Protein of unknown function [Thermobacillus xylanilyticus]|jgi:serine/threonine-protein phosphatase 2A regulatory subunit B'